MFIVEGPDDLGKTTFAQKVVKHVCEKTDFPAYYNHMTRPPVSFNFTTDYLERITKYAVQDRFHLGGFVYHNQMPWEHMSWLAGHLHAQHSYVVMIIANDLRWYEKRLKESKRDQMYDVDKMMQFHSRFNSLVSAPGIDRVIYVGEHQPYVFEQDIIEAAEHWIRQLKFSLRLQVVHMEQAGEHKHIRSGGQFLAL